jgi:hypothetical protein
VAITFHSNQYKSIHERAQSSLAQDTDVFACLAEALLLPFRIHLHLQHPAPFVLLLVFSFDRPPYCERVLSVSLHFMIAEMFSSLDVTRACHSRFHSTRVPVFHIFQECLASSRYWLLSSISSFLWLVMRC